MDDNLVLATAVALCHQPTQRADAPGDICERCLVGQHHIEREQTGASVFAADHLCDGLETHDTDTFSILRDHSSLCQVAAKPMYQSIKAVFVSCGLAAPRSFRCAWLVLPLACPALNSSLTWERELHPSTLSDARSFPPGEDRSRVKAESLVRGGEKRKSGRVIS